MAVQEATLTKFRVPPQRQKIPKNRRRRRRRRVLGNTPSMNSLDLFDYTVSVSPNNSPDPQNPESTPAVEPEASSSQPTLNEEVTQVIGQLGRFWGGVRKQSQSAFEAARKDLGGVVTQAQKEFEKLSQRSTTVPETSTQASSSNDSNAEPDSTSTSSTSVPTQEPTPENVPPSSSFFSRLQNSLPPTLTPTVLSSTLQRHLPENLQHGLNLENANADFVQLRETLATNIHRVQQGTTLQQAEKLAEQYMHKGEALFKEAGEFLKDAVKIVPPEESEDSPGVIWDGTDIWSMPAGAHTSAGGRRKGKAKESDVIFNMPKAAAKRADALLKKLKTDPEVLRQDPQLAEDEAAKDLWTTFVKDQVEAQGGMNSEAWIPRISAALEGHEKDEDSSALAALRDQLVPDELTDSEFWTRYFFRVHQIEREEEQRRVLLADANQDDEDFSWEDEDDGGVGDDELSQSQSTKTPENGSSSILAPSPKPSTDSTVTATPPIVNAPGAASQGTSPRLSEDSYDVVSSGNASSTGGKFVDTAAKENDKGDTGDDSDWE